MRKQASAIALFAVLTCLYGVAFAAGPTVEVVYPTAWVGMFDDAASVVLRVGGDKQLTALSATFDIPIGSAAAGTTFTAKPPPSGGLAEVVLPIATSLWGSTMTVVVTNKLGQTTTLVYEYSSINVP